MTWRDGSALTTLVRRHRRALAAACAGLATLLALGSVTAAAQPSVASSGAPTLAPDERRMPIGLSAVNQGLSAGSVIDVVALASDVAPARIVARSVRVLESRPAGALASAGAVVVIAVTEPQALAIADAASGGTLTALIHGS